MEDQHTYDRQASYSRLKPVEQSSTSLDSVHVEQVRKDGVGSCKLSYFWGYRIRAFKGLLFIPIHGMIVKWKTPTHLSTA